MRRDTAIGRVCVLVVWLACLVSAIEHRALHIGTAGTIALVAGTVIAYLDLLP